VNGFPYTGAAVIAASVANRQCFRFNSKSFMTSETIKMNLLCRCFWTSFAVLLAVPCALVGQDRNVHFQLVDRARELIRKGEYAHAIALLQPVYSESLSASRELADVYRRAGKRLAFVELARIEADKGNPYVSSALAELMLDGYVLEPRSIERYFRNGVRGGIGSAAYQLGNIYSYGLEAGFSGLSMKAVAGVPIDLENAREMFRLCANDPSFGRFCSVGLAHAILELRAGEPAEAIALLEKADAYDVLWGMHYFGATVPLDRAKASSYLHRLKERPADSRASCARAVATYAHLLATDDADALYEIASSFSAGRRRAECIPGGPRHHIELLERAFQAGSIDAADILGDYYYFGNVVRRDPVLAFYYHSALGETGNAEQRRRADDRLSTLESRMSPAELSEARLGVRRRKQPVER
jgi:TPR repeat protein